MSANNLGIHLSNGLLLNFKLNNVKIFFYNYKALLLFNVNICIMYKRK